MINGHALSPPLSFMAAVPVGPEPRSIAGGRLEGSCWRRRPRSRNVTGCGVTLRLRTPLRADAALAGVTVVYPLTVVYWEALVLGRQASAAAFTPAQAGLFVLAVFTASASWQFLLVDGGALIGRVAGRRRGMLAISLASALLIAWLAARILSS
jgi:hypothetical protein